jgi:hypothetical protein
LQFQTQGPEPSPLSSVTEEAAPALHRLLPEGAVLVVAPLAAPHAPLTGGLAAVAQDAVVPSGIVLLLPTHAQLQGPEALPFSLETDVAVPALQRLVAGADGTFAPFAEPQVPLIGAEEAWHSALVLPEPMP